MNESTIFTFEDNHIDDHVDDEIRECIKNKRNFFMFAGAGSGKTRSLVNALNDIAVDYGDILRLQSKQVAVITYTNAACDEIMRRVGHNSLFAVSTIHSFLWELIKPYQRDIKAWVKAKIESDLAELECKQNSPRRKKDYSEEIVKKQQRLNRLAIIAKFSYNPNGDNVGQDSLDHAEVISMGSEFIQVQETMQRVLTSKYPILLIDESQDTKKELVDAIWVVDKANPDFTIGMFGDTMQKIYMDGKENLAHCVPDNWEHPAKIMNHRSNTRIIQLANSVRATIDKQQQKARSDKVEGHVHLFIAPNTVDKDETERTIYEQMRAVTSDENWLNPSKRKVLVLEHSMAASRIGFSTLNLELSKHFDQSFRDGSMVELSFLMKTVYPAVQAQREGNKFAVMKILRKYSPLLKESNFAGSVSQSDVLKTASSNLVDLAVLWANNNEPSCLDVYKKLSSMGLFELPKRIEEVLSEKDDVGYKVAALRRGLNVPFSELICYWDYISDNTQFSTHQGIKGLEFDRVAVIMDDESAGGFLFSYEKLFGAKSISDTDKKNEREGKDNSISRTMRLFYVTCTRAIDSLALIAYTSNPESVKNTAMVNNWFAEDEIILTE